EAGQARVEAAAQAVQLGRRPRREERPGGEAPGEGQAAASAVGCLGRAERAAALDRRALEWPGGAEEDEEGRRLSRRAAVAVRSGDSATKLQASCQVILIQKDRSN